MVQSGQMSFLQDMRGMQMKSDVEIAQEAEMLPISKIAAELELTEDDLEL